MKIQKIERGIHTIELYACNLKYEQVQKVMDWLVEEKQLQIVRRDPFNIDRHAKSDFLIASGVRIHIYQSHDKSNGLGLVINPSSLLAGSYQPTQLFHPKKKACGEVLLQTEEILHELRLEDNAHPRKLVVQPEELSLSQMDLTMNLWLSNDADLPELIRLFKKAKLPPSFKRCKGKNREIDRHCFVMNCHTVAFKAYDKIYELQRDGRCPAKLAGKKLLRIEVSLKREAFVKKLKLNRTDDLHTMLKAGYDAMEDIILDYLHKLFPCTGRHLSFNEAIRCIQRSGLKEKQKEQMCFLVRKISDGKNGWNSALDELRKEYSIRDDRTIQALYQAFDSLNLNPIPLRNDSTFGSLPFILDMIQQAISKS